MLCADLVQSVQDISFTYHEAYSKMMAGMQPLMACFVSSVLPKIVQEGLKSQIIDQIDQLVGAQLNDVIELVVPPQQKAVLEELLENKVRVPFGILEEPALSEGQVYLRVNQHEREINVSVILKEVGDAVDAFIHATQPEVKHG